MAIDFENTILGLVASVSRIEASMEGLAKKEDVAQLAQKLDSHIEADLYWRRETNDRIAAGRGWWQVVLGSVASSGILLLAVEFFRGKH